MAEAFTATLKPKRGFLGGGGGGGGWFKVGEENEIKAAKVSPLFPLFFCNASEEQNLINNASHPTFFFSFFFFR